jgi:hypothetical protein
VDPAKRSGWALFADGELELFGEIENTDQVAAGEVLARACDFAESRGLPLVVVGETWGKGGKRGMKQWQGLGARWKAWQWAAEALAPHRACLAKSRIMRVHLSTWRATFGMTRLRSEAAKRAAVRLVERRLDIPLEPEQHDVAEAILIGLWATKAGAVGEKLSKRVMKVADLYRGDR